MYKCNHCNIAIPDNQAEERIVKIDPKDNPKCYCRDCGEPVVYIPDMPQVTDAVLGSQDTLTFNSDNRIITNNYYGGGTPDEQAETLFGVCKKSEARFCKQCRQWVPMTFFNTDRGLCDICIEKEGIKAFDEGKSFYEMGLYDEALEEFLKYEPVCKRTEVLVKLQYQIGRSYYEQKKWKEAFKYFIKTREQVPESLFYIGLCFYNGYGIPKDLNKANVHIRKAAELGNQEAKDFLVAEEQKRLQNLANEAMLEFKNNHFSESRRLWEDAEKQGFQLSAYDINCIGVCYWHEEYYNKALEYFSKAAEMGRADAAYNLGIMYEFGIGTDLDREKSINWYKKSADLGCLTAKFNLAKIYEYGDSEGTDDPSTLAYRNHDEAVRLFEIVAESGDEDEIENELKYNLINDPDDGMKDYSPEAQLENIIANAMFELELMNSINHCRCNT